MLLRYCTFTGVDSHTDLERLKRISLKYPFVEWGFLWSPKLAGNHPRYMLAEEINDIADELFAYNLSLHICGKGVQDYVIDANLYEFPIHLNCFKRIQLNFAVDRFDDSFIPRLDKKIAATSQQVITQYNSANWYLWRRLANRPNHAILFDSSGGQGNKIDLSKVAARPRPIGIFCGFAGGLGPDNIDAFFEEEMFSKDDIVGWIDMESGVRTKVWLNDVFDLDKVEDVLERIVNHDCVVV